MLERMDAPGTASIHAKKCALQISFITAQIQKAKSALEFNFVRVATLQILGRGCRCEARFGSEIRC